MEENQSNENIFQIKCRSVQPLLKADWKNDVAEDQEILKNLSAEIFCAFKTNSDWFPTLVQFVYNSNYTGKHLDNWSFLQTDIKDGTL